VLWCGIAELCRRNPHLRVAIYTGDVDVTPAEIRAACLNRFGIELPPVDFVYLRMRHWVEASRYPFLTLLGQSFGSIILSAEALLRFPPPVFVDTTGYAFSFPVARWLGGCAVGCYVHYPTISTDMLERVRSREASFNNDGAIARSAACSRLKFMYYQAFSWVYGFAGRRADVVMVNSSWTGNHIECLWGQPAMRVYPPCNTTEFQALPLQPPGGRQPIVLSIAQFRPEKAHAVQLQALAALFAERPDLAGRVSMVLAGAVRHEGDQGRLDALKALAVELGIADSVRFEINVSFARLKELMTEASVGIHTMTDEHFGIGARPPHRAVLVERPVVREGERAELRMRPRNNR
jgi:alpha-1,2-mannosyltransferase